MSSHITRCFSCDRVTTECGFINDGSCEGFIERTTFLGMDHMIELANRSRSSRSGDHDSAENEELPSFEFAHEPLPDTVRVSLDGQQITFVQKPDIEIMSDDDLRALQQQVLKELIKRGMVSGLEPGLGGNADE